MSHKKGITLHKIFALLIIIGITYFISLHFKAEKKNPAPTMPPRPVKTAKAFTKSVDNYIESFGNLSADQSVDIISQVTGQIKEIRFCEGDIVKKGQLLVVIDEATCKAELDKDKAALDQNKIDLALKKDALKRNQQLFEKKLISEFDFEKYKSDVAAAEAAVKLDEANLESAKINLSYCQITSPIDGVAGKKLVDAGNIVTANQGPKLSNIKTIDPLSINFTISERYLSILREAMAKGQLKVTIMPDDYSQKEYEGVLKAIDNIVDNDTGTISLKAKIPNETKELWPGQFVRVKLVINIADNAVLVPYEAIQLGQNGDYIYVITNGKAEIRDSLETGIRDGDNIVVKDKIKAGETVVTVGQMGLAPGVPVVDITEETDKLDKTSDATSNQKDK